MDPATSLVLCIVDSISTLFVLLGSVKIFREALVCCTCIDAFALISNKNTTVLVTMKQKKLSDWGSCSRKQMV